MRFAQGTNHTSQRRGPSAMRNASHARPCFHQCLPDAEPIPCRGRGAAVANMPCHAFAILKVCHERWGHRAVYMPRTMRPPRAAMRARGASLRVQVEVVKVADHVPHGPGEVALAEGLVALGARLLDALRLLRGHPAEDDDRVLLLPQEADPVRVHEVQGPGHKVRVGEAGAGLLALARQAEHGLHAPVQLVSQPPVHLRKGKTAPGREHAEPEGRKPGPPCAHIVSSHVHGRARELGTEGDLVLGNALVPRDLDRYELLGGGPAVLDAHDLLAVPGIEPTPEPGECILGQVSHDAHGGRVQGPRQAVVLGGHRVV
mmetsp:Transcript_3856/g.12907  ORF Transcript_3856/g.12907 Transcript_3856/m.12907 type:complete len:316 (+) Transcript_3856:372-1319(+)